MKLSIDFGRENISDFAFRLLYCNLFPCSFVIAPLFNAYIYCQEAENLCYLDEAKW